MSSAFTPDFAARVISPASLVSLSPQAQPPKTKDAAQQFEALLISTLLRTARESSTGAWGDEDEESSQTSTMFDLAGQQLSEMMARQGGFGLSRLIVQGLDAKGAQAAPNGH